MQRLFYYSWRPVILFLVIGLFLFGRIPLLSQSSGQSSSSNSGTLTAWEKLYSEGQTIFAQQKKDLEALKTEITSLKIGSAELTDLSERLSESNENLKRYNAQIAERMQDRDLDLYNAYGDIDELEAKVKEQSKTIIHLALVIGIIVLGSLVAVGFMVAKKFGKLKVSIGG